MSDVKIVTKYENDQDEMIEITKDFKAGNVTIRIDDGDDEGHVALIRVPDHIWEQLS